MKKIKNILLILFTTILTIAFIELTYNYFFRENFLGEKLDRESFYKEYSDLELDKSKPMRHKFNGGNCISRGLLTKTGRMNWHPRFGANDNSVDLDCVNKLFTKRTVNVVFFGGSSMANNETPNFLTSIEYYAFKDNFEKYRSINLANSGARMSNNLGSFIEHIPKINNVDHIIFLDGINEFTGVQLGANPEHDTYWIQGVEARINKPEIIILEKLIQKSLFFELIFKKIFNYKSIRDKSNVKFANKENIEIAAADYSYRKKIIQILCLNQSVKCHFLLQPGIYFDDSQLSYSNEIKKYYSKFFKENFNLYNYGYKKIKDQNQDIVDFSKIFNNKKDIFIDAAHFNKKGSKILGNKIFEFLEKR